MTVVATTSLKGGVGKTTLTVNLAYAFAQRGWNCLIIDGDPQGSVTASLSKQGVPRPGLYELIEQNQPLSQVVIQSRVPRFSLLTSGNPPPDQWSDWTKRLEDPATWKRVTEATTAYDLVLVDAPSGLHGPTVGILSVANYAVVPLQIEPLSLRTIQTLLTSFGSFRDRGATFQLAGLVPTMLASEVSEVADVYNQLRQEMPEGLLLETSIPRDPLFFQASLWGIPLGLFEPVPPLATTFDFLAAELEPRLGLTNRPTRTSYGPLLE